MAKQETQRKSPEQLWIVKAGETILGPYKIAELAQAVRSKSVSLLDEAKNPYGRWLFVRDIPEIQTTISRIAETEDTFEKTQTAAHTNITVTRNIEDENTPVPPQVPLVHSPISQIKPTPAPTSSSASKDAQGPASEQSVKSFSLNPPAEKIPWAKYITMGALAVAFIVGLAVFIQRKSWESDQKRTWAEFQQYYVAQLYDEAYKKLKEYQKDFPDQAPALTRAGFLYLNPGKELVNARRMFERSSQLDPNNKENMVQNLNGLGLVSLYEGQSQAAKASFDRALTLEPGNIPTRINLISMNMGQGQWDDAYTLAQQIQAAEPKKSFLIQATVSVLSQAPRERATHNITNLLKSIDTSSYLRPMMRLIAIKLMSIHGDTTGMEAQLKLFFEDLPSLHLGFSETPVIDQRWKDWNFLYQFCTDIKGPSSLDAEVSALKVVCVAQVQKWTEAEKILSEAQMRFPANSKLFQAQLHLLSLMEKWPDVRALTRSAQLTQDTAINWMFALACTQEKNKSCTELYLNPLLQKSIVPTAVYDLQAKNTCVREKINDVCRAMIANGLTQDPQATGLLKTRLMIEAGL